MQMTIYDAVTVGSRSNCVYPNPVTVTDADTMRQAAAFDHVCAAYKQNYRSVDNFLKEQLSQIQDSGVKASVLRITEQAGGKVQEAGEKIHTVRKNLIQSAKNAVQTFRGKGKDALRKAVSSMKIPSALARIQEGLHGAVECMNRQADKMAVLNSELHAAGDHIKNAGRIFRGKELEKVETQAVDKGITVKIRKSFLALSGRLSSMEQTTDNVRKRLEQFAQKGNKKPSVKGELKKLKEEKKMVPQLPVPVKQQTRE